MSERNYRTALISFMLIFLCQTFFVSAQTYHSDTTRKIFQLTGEYDRPLRRYTVSRTDTNAGVVGTDLGSTFEHKGRLYFLFGDTVGPPIKDQDCFAYTTATLPADIRLNFPLDGEGDFQQISIPGVTTGGMQVPSGGISYNNIIYIVHTTQWYAAGNNMEKSVMAFSSDDGATWIKLYDLSKVGADHDMTDTHFINVSMSIVNSEAWPGLPYPGDNLLIFGSGAYRKSNVYLAAMPADSISNKSSLRYLSSISDGVPVWSIQESAALALFNQPQVGEFSCYLISQLNKWVMLYNASNPRGITMRTADFPWGTYSSGTVILEPWWDEAYGRFMHVSWSDPLGGHRDAFHDGLMGGANLWGGEYGPYLIPRFTTGNAEKCQIYYTMSTWNPYQSILVRSEVGAGLPARPADSETQILMPGNASWFKSTGTWFKEFAYNDTPWITTNVTGNAEQGIMYRWLPRDNWNRQLSFTIHGGDAEVMLVEGGGEIPTTGDLNTIYNDIKSGKYGDVIQCTWGHKDNTINIPISWDLRPFDRANLKVVVIDNLTADWGFISLSRMTLVRNVPGSLQVTIEPAQAIHDGAQWRVTSDSAWYNSGDIKEDLSVGNHAVEFKEINGWHTAPDQTVVIYPYQVTYASVEYSPFAGLSCWKEFQLYSP